MKNKRKIFIGTSGWNYDHWKGSFYPPGLSQTKFLDYYSQYFQTVEINNTFYQLPKKETFVKWKDIAPKGFIFAVKASRFITHMKKLKGAKQALNKFLNRAEALKDKLGPILFQLPPNLGFNLKRLDDFLKILPKDFYYTFEFRNESWFNNEVYELLSKHKIALCFYDLNGKILPKEVESRVSSRETEPRTVPRSGTGAWITANFVYIRLHGPGSSYKGSYSDKSLSDWAELFKKWTKQRKKIYCYFDNDERGYAPKNAMTLKDIIK